MSRRSTIKISLVINSLSAGGAERVITALANEWCEQRGYDVEIITFAHEKREPFFPLSPRVLQTPAGISTRELPFLKKLTALPAAVRRLRHLIQESRPDLVVAFMDQANILTLLAARNSELPVIVSERVVPEKSSLLQPDKPAPVRWLIPSLRNHLYARAAAVVVQTQDIFRSFPPAVRNRIVVIPNPVIVGPDAPADLTLARPAVLGMGRLTEQKRFDLLLTAFARAARDNREWSLAILGEGELGGELRALAQQLAIAEHVSFPGTTKSPAAVLRQAEIFVLSSDYEGFPNALLEAMACGRAVIATDCRSGPRELIEDGQNGLLVPPGDEEQLAAALQRLMRDEALRRRLGQAAKEVLQRYELKRIVELWEQVIERVIE